MDELASKNQTEHDKIRLAKKARLHYKPANYINSYIKVNGNRRQAKLKVAKAYTKDILVAGRSKTKTIGFVTTKTYEELMGTARRKVKQSTWISEHAENIMLGCDPEFVLVAESGEARHAAHVLSYRDKFGSDGPNAEIRPDPSKEVPDVIKDIKNLLSSSHSAQKAAEYDWVGGASYTHPSMSRRHPIGGHIHLGLPNFPQNSEISTKLMQSRATRILDELVAIPLIRIDTPCPEKRRQELGYGKAGDFKQQENRFEWRVPSGLWLVHPEFALYCLSTVKAVTEEVWKRFEDSEFDKDFMLRITNDKNLEKSFKCLDHDKVIELINGSNNSTVNTDLIRQIHGRLKSMSTYNRYKGEINNFIKLCCQKQLPFSGQNLSLKRGWIENKPI